MKQNEKNTMINSCPVCGENTIIKYLDTKDYFFTQETFSLSKCESCDFVFTNPIPKDLSKYYETEEYLSHNSKKSGIISKIYSSIRTINIKRKFDLVSNYSSKGSILDIGCGTGELLSYFKNENWKTTGIEPNENARNIAISENGIDVLNEDTLSTLPSKSFDIVSMWHVLEHVPDLNKRISEVSNLTKDNGTMIFALPNLNSPDAKKYGSYWSALDVPRHLYHFTQSTFEKLITKHGLKLVHAEPMKFDSYYVSMLSEKYLGNKLYLFSAFINGLKSNLKAKKNNNYSSMIFVVKKEF